MEQGSLRGRSPTLRSHNAKEVMETLRDDAGAALDFIYPVPGHPPMWPGLGHVAFVSFPFSCLLFN